MLTPRAGYLASPSADADNNLCSVARRPASHNVQIRGHSEDEARIKLNFLPSSYSTWFQDVLASRNTSLYNSFISALSAADALAGADSPSPIKTPSFPVNVCLSGTISAHRPVSRSSLALLRRQDSQILEQRESPLFGIDLTGFSYLCRPITAI